MIRTKILATMGPANANVQTLVAMFEAGCDACRLNFSHGSLDQHLQTLSVIREAAARWNQPIAILGDLCGPKIRLGAIRDADGTGGMPIAVGDELTIQRESIVGEHHRVNSTYPRLIDDIAVGDRILIEDGLFRFICIEKSPAELRCRCTMGGVLKSNKGINLPNTAVNIPSITDRDWERADWAVENDLDYLALSFVRKAEDVQLLREHLRKRRSEMQIIAKIEKSEALADIDNILDASDGLMVARGDLGVEIDVARVPIIQKDLIARCRVATKPVIVATQMLQSMIEAASPTRAEVSDVANAIFDGADSVMLSGETSVGKFPVGAVHIMNHIAETTEEYLATQPPKTEVAIKPSTMPLSVAVAKGAREVVMDLKARLVVVYSQTGATARIFSKFRFNVPIVALSSDHRALRRMALLYGVLPQGSPPPDDMTALVRDVDRLVRERAFAMPGDRIVIAAGSSLAAPGTMNAIVMHTVGESMDAETVNR